MTFLLDTNVIIHLIHKKEPLNKNVRRHDPSKLAISGFTEAELAYGVEKSAPQHRETNRLARATLLATFTRVYHDDAVSEAYGKIKAHLVMNKLYAPSNELDIFIAATAVAKNLTLVTENIKDFNGIPDLKLANWSV